MCEPFDRFLRSQEFVVLDGGLATALEAQGADLNDALWSAALLLRGETDSIRRVHCAYFEAGADVATTASYQATFEGFEKKGCDPRHAAELMASSVRVAKQARDEFWNTLSEMASDSEKREKPLVAASVGCYGAFLANGAEYNGRYGENVSSEFLESWHKPKVEALWESRPDVLAFETIPRVDEAIALTRLLQKMPSDACAWITFACRDGTHLTSGDLLADAVTAVCTADSSRKICAIGINCTPPTYVSEGIRTILSAMDESAFSPSAAAAVSGSECAETEKGGARRHVIVYPNSGEAWDGEKKMWVAGNCAGSDQSFGEMARAWRDAGAAIVGGCCRTGPATVAAVRRALAEGGS